MSIDKKACLTLLRREETALAVIECGVYQTLGIAIRRDGEGVKRWDERCKAEGRTDTATAGRGSGAARM